MGQKARGSKAAERLVAFRVNEEEERLLEANMQRRGEPKISGYFRTLMKEDEQ